MATPSTRTMSAMTHAHRFYLVHNINFIVPCLAYCNTQMKIRRRLRLGIRPLAEPQQVDSEHWR